MKSLHDGVSSGVNDAGTVGKSDTGLTDGRSLDVHALPETIGALTAMRTRYGADSPIGHACSNLLEQIAILPGYVQPDWATHESQTLPYLIGQQIAALRRLQAA